jgi:hypothetical protein
MSEFITAKCHRCFERRRLRLTYSEVGGGEWWYCRPCKAKHDKEVEGMRAISNRFGEARGK